MRIEPPIFLFLPESISICQKERSRINGQYFVALITTLVLGAVFITGCTSPTTTSPTPSTITSTVETRDAFLEQYVISLERELRNDTTVSVWLLSGRTNQQSVFKRSILT